MARLIGIGGSLRAGSYNSGLLRAAAELMPEGSTLEVHSIRSVPLYDADEEAAIGVPDSVAVLKEALAGADGLLLATPEYNNSLPGVLKNAIDWMSRPPADSARVFAGKAAALVGASPGGFGTILAQEAWLPVLRTLGTRPWFGRKHYVSHAGKLFDGDGNLVDEAARKALAEYLAAFVSAI
ncbi:NAD(P)H-dependent oxidoreductase [Novosphingobium flavum]|uniref:NAD(P)H-dependent oxidoreductase n=1 Tax=Novosphingobium flavum TaxID=1778672 RepID=A0A7X1FPL0_9SPHN|nr:NADPH-dependent FMN reductase [Novosphingobium flavum]MBC2664660.1 NAD(P)H-dependent oxidoreductase [Novosphingobium flavum]